MKRNKKIVQVSLWKEGAPRRLAWEARTQVEAGGGGVWVSLQLSRGPGAGSGGHLRDGAGDAGGAGQRREAGRLRGWPVTE